MDLFKIDLVSKEAAFVKLGVKSPGDIKEDQTLQLQILNLWC